jgi:hypothetical protein
LVIAHRRHYTSPSLAAADWVGLKTAVARQLKKLDEERFFAMPVSDEQAPLYSKVRASLSCQLSEKFPSHLKHRHD